MRVPPPFSTPSVSPFKFRQMPACSPGPGLHWLVGSPSFPPVTIVSSLKCIHAFAPSDPDSPDLRKESVQEEARLLTVDMKLDVLCFAAKELPLSYAISSLVIPGLIDQINSLMNLILPNFCGKTSSGEAMHCVT